MVSSTASERLCDFSVPPFRLGDNYKDVEFCFPPIASTFSRDSRKVLRINIHFRIYLQSLYDKAKRELSVFKTRNIDIVELSRSSFQTVF